MVLVQAIIMTTRREISCVILWYKKAVTEPYIDMLLYM